MLRNIITKNSLAAGTSILVALQLLLTGCTESGPTVREHLQATASAPFEPQQASTIKADATLATIQSVHKSRFELADEIDAEGTSTDRLLQIVATVSPFILSNTYLKSIKNQSSDEFVISLGLMNRALTTAYARDAAKVRQSGVLEQYENIVFQNCQDSLQYCKRLPFFSKDNKTAEILLILAEAKEAKVNETRQAKGTAYFDAVARLQKLYRTTNEMLNTQVNVDYYLRYVRYSPDIYEYYRNLSATDKKNHNEELRVHRDFLNTALLILKNQERKDTRETYCNFVIGLKPYTFNLGKPQSLEQKGIRQIVEEFIRCANEKKSLDGLIKDYLDEEHKEQTRAVNMANEADSFVIKDHSYYYALAFLKKSPEVLENLSVKDDGRDDIAFFVIDRLFYEAIDQKMAIQYWKQIKGANDLDMLKFVQNYVRVQVAYTLKATQGILDRSLKEEYKARGGLSSEMYTRVVDRVNQSTQFEWEALKTRVRFLREFLLPIFDEKLTRVNLPADLKPASVFYAGLKDELDSMNEHLNFVATMPLMLVMSYYMAKAPGQIKIFIPWWSTTNQWWNIDGTQALTRFFEDHGEWSRFFGFGTTAFRVDEYQMKHVFDWSLRSGIFDNISFAITKEDKELLKIPGADSLNSEYLFFHQYIENMMRKHLVSVSHSIDDLEKTMKNQEFMDRFNNICEDPLAAPVRLDLDQLAANPTVNDKTLKDGIGNIYGSYDRANVLRMDRDKVEALLDILKQHFNAANPEKRFSPEKLAKRGEIIRQIENELEPYYRLERDLNRKIIEADKLIVNAKRNCFLRLYKAEILRQQILFTKNVDFFKSVHAGITLLNLFPENLTDETADPSVQLRALSSNLIAKWKESPEAKQLAPNMIEDIAKRMQTIAQVSFQSDIFKLTAATPGEEGVTLNTRVEAAIGGMFLVQNLRPYFVEVDGKQVEWGVHVDGVESFARSSQLLLPKSVLSRAGFRHNRRDTLMRIRRQLQTTKVNALEAAKFIGLDQGKPGELDSREVDLAPMLVVPIGTFAELANNSLFTNNDVMDANYQLDQNRFVKEAMSQFAGDNRGGNQFTYWQTNGTKGMSFLESRYTLMQRFYESGALDISKSDTRKCARDEWKQYTMEGSQPGCEIFSVTAKSILDQRLEIVNLYKLDDKEREILNWIGRPGRYHEDVASEFRYKEKDDAATWTYFDQYYKKTFTTQQAQTMDHRVINVDRIDGRAQLDEFRDSYKFKISGDRHLFPINNYVVQLDRNRARAPLLLQQDFVSKMEETIIDLEDSKKDLGEIVFEHVLNIENVHTDSRYKDNDWRFIDIKVRTEGERKDTPIYLRDDSESAMAWFRNIMQDFYITEMDCETLPREGDPDYVAIDADTQKEMKEAIDCRARYKVWQRFTDKKRLEDRQSRRAAGNE